MNETNEKFHSLMSISLMKERRMVRGQKIMKKARIFCETKIVISKIADILQTLLSFFLICFDKNREGHSFFD